MLQALVLKLGKDQVMTTAGKSLKGTTVRRSREASKIWLASRSGRWLGHCLITMDKSLDKRTEYIVVAGLSSSLF
jgi:hypothetical protein